MAIAHPVPAPTDNLLLAKLCADARARWLPALERVDLLKGRVLYDAGSEPSHVYFPTTAIVSLLHATSGGAATQVAMVGHEGVVGLSTLMGGASPSSHAVVQRAGQGWRLKVPLLKDEFDQAGTVMQVLLRYTQTLLTQMAQTAICNRHHSLECQLCRWLLLNLDRQPDSNELAVTQEGIAGLLGVRREGVTEYAQKLQTAGVIRYARGRIEVLDRPGLESRVCECYGLVKQEYERLLPPPPPRGMSPRPFQLVGLAPQALTG